MRKNKFSKLSFRFIISTLIPAIFVIIMVGVVSIGIVSKNKMNSIRQGIVEQAISNDADIYNNLQSLKNILNMEDNYSVMYNYIKNNTPENKQIYYEKCVKIINEYVMYNSENVVSAWFASFEDNLLITDRLNNKGDIIVNNFEEYVWYDYEMLLKGNVYYSDIYSNKLSDKYTNDNVVSIVCPIFDWKTNSLIGAYGFEISMNSLNSYMTLNGYNDILSIIVNDDGELNYCKNAVIRNRYKEIQEILLGIKNDNNKYVNYSGRKYYVVETSFAMTGWNVIYLVSDSEIKQDINSLRYPLYMVIGIACLIITIVLMKFIKRFTVKINNVKNYIVQISDGTYDNRMKIDSDDEFGELAVKFNDAIDYLKHSAEHDDVTKIYNITTFYSKAHKLIRENDYSTGRYAIIRLDIDHFRVVNDIYNWQIGDAILKYIADSIKSHLNKESICGRMSGDIFVICMKYNSIEEIEESLLNIKNDIVKYDIVVNINPHFGIYLDAEKELPIYLMCDRAGIALSLIKGNMLSTFSYYDSMVNRMNMDIKFIETSIQRAFDERQFFIQLQPKYNMHTNEIVGAEALVRWNHPEKGYIRPESFIPVFEKNGTILKLDEYVWEETCRCLSKWHKMGMKGIPISVNISRIHVYNKHLVEKLCDLVKKYDIPVELLQLEFTESALLDDANELYELMYKLKDKNFVLLMDDFASGYSSLNTLKSAPFDIVKLDKEFICSVAESQRDRMLVASTISMIDMQNMDVVVEGVETEEQVDILLQAGCDIAQGYYFSKPIDIIEFEKLVYGIE